MGFISEFKEFAMRGNVMDMAIGIVIGGAFGKIVTAFVDNVVMPPIAMLMGKVDFSEVLAFELGTPDGAEEPVFLKFGAFAQTVLDFLIIAMAIFIVIKIMNAAKKKEEEAPAPPPRSEVLLEEIRDALSKG